MSNINQTVSVTLTMNGEPARVQLDRLIGRSHELRKGLTSATTLTEKNKLQRELDSVDKQIAKLTTSIRGTESVLNHLSDSSIQGLRGALKHLKRELAATNPNTEEWRRYAEQIRQVEARLGELTATVAQGDSMWDKISGFATKLWPVTDLLQQAGSYVSELVEEYAAMEQEMAGVRKYTGMTEEDVAALNEALKGMDTRTSREGLNQLAQEAGRLGKTSQEDVLGFVRAADQINVALDDLGEGATLTISKLTGVFGDEERYGTEQAMLKVGSVINDLSQNCAASAPFLAEFASRMGGVGAQAGMTIPQIMAYGAVLDSAGMNVESTSTALSQVVVRMMQAPAKYAQVAGLDVQRFSEMLRTDVNGALVLFLETLQQAGGIDSLAPMFKDMGESGSQAIATLSTLAARIGEVKEQQTVAAESFEQATSISAEFGVQNETVAAQLDKARNRMHEMRVALGEKLQPVMLTAYSALNALAQVLVIVARFVYNNRGAIVALAAGVAAYNVVTKASIVLSRTWNGVCAAGTAIAQTSRLAMLALRVVYLHVTGAATKAAAATRLFNAACKASPVGLVIGVATALVGVLTSVMLRTKETTKAMEQARDESQQWRDSLTDISQATAQACAAETAQLKTLYEAAVNQSLSTDRRRQAAEKLQQLYPDYFKNLSAEEIMVGNAKTQYDKLRDSILQAARARAAAEKIASNEGEILDLEMQLEAQKEEQQKAVEEYNRAMARAESLKGADLGQFGAAQTHASILNIKMLAADHNVKATTDKIAELNKANATLADKHINTRGAAADGGLSPGGSGVGASATPSAHTADRFAAEKGWREKAEADARISYAKGETDSLTHAARMEQILLNYYGKVLARTDLSETERLNLMAEQAEARKKQAERATAASVEAEEATYSARLAELKQFYLDGAISKETYDIKAEEAEIEHQDRLVKTTAEGSAERAKAEERLTQLKIAQMERRQGEIRKKEEEMAAIKKEYFGDNAAELQAQYTVMEAALTEVYNRELAAAGDNAAERLRIEEAYEKAKLALRQKYGQLTEEDNRNTMQRWADDTKAWLDSDGGKAVTGSFDTIVSGMSSIFSQLNSLTQAELEMTTAAITRRYDAEIAAAEGNSFKIKKLEKEKEQAIAKAKNEANRKMFAMQVIQAVAQTAQNAIAAYGSAASIPVTGFILAPIAAAMAVTAGALQIAAIKKQQQAAEAQGYARGGFTPEGGVYEVAGVVHKGEWVASQRLTRDPRTRPILEALDYAQRTNTIGAITAADVSRSITAPVALAQAAPLSALRPGISTDLTDTATPSTPSSTLSAELTDTLRGLKERLNEPFVTVNTVTGDHGTLRAQQEYDRLIRNKTPKHKK